MTTAETQQNDDVWSNWDVGEMGLVMNLKLAGDRRQSKVLAKRNYVPNLRILLYRFTK